jgi:hypothetical protein
MELAELLWFSFYYITAIIVLHLQYAASNICHNV